MHLQILPYQHLIAYHLQIQKLKVYHPDLLHFLIIYQYGFRQPRQMAQQPVTLLLNQMGQEPNT